MSDDWQPPCLGCGKTLRHDFYGYCMDCADEHGISDVFPPEVREKNLDALRERVLSDDEKRRNLAKMRVYLSLSVQSRIAPMPILVSRRKRSQ